MTITSQKLAEDLKRQKSGKIQENYQSEDVEEIEEEAEYCPICYTNTLEADSETTVELNCQHRFCKDCFV